MSRVQDSSRSYGSVEITQLGTAELSPSTRPTVTLSMRHDLYTYLPPPDLRAELPPGFSIEMEIYTAADGMRRFLPHSGPKEFIANAFVAGLVTLSRDRGLTGHQRYSYRAMKFFRDRILHMQEHFGREFGYSRDLYIRRPNRETDGERSVIPGHLGRSSDGSGRTWSPRVLCAEGRARARFAGVERPNTQTAIAYGLLAAAERDPLNIRPDETAALIRGALFEPADEEAPISEECLAQVTERSLVLFGSHLDDSPEEFNRWFSDGNSNLFGAIAGRDLSIPVVRKAILELGWQGYRYVADCVNYFTQGLQRTLPNCLTPGERDLFSQIYAPQPYLGGLPLILLLERRQLFAPMIDRLWSSPGDSETIAILHRLLEYYSTMMSVRRPADVRRHQRQRRLEIAEPTLVDRNAIVTAPPATESPIERILRRFVEMRDLRCILCGRLTECAVVDEGRLRVADDDPIRLELRCNEHGSQGQVAVTPEALRSIAEELAIEDPE